ncbi:flagellar protein FlaG [Solibacillus daqui]|uniref:flagellar protein FlaG n=1 Tax=Solibacillus daqui TaxID=2912187 RepID=UPI002366337F|nr:flagellar protein FlaG [Solibacillus daqui]
MRISGNASLEAVSVAKTASNVASKEIVEKQGSKPTIETPMIPAEQVKPIDNSEETKVKVQDAVNKMNEMLDVNNSSSKFMYHEGLERYYVTVVDRETEEVVKEIPPKRLLDAFYEMQKMLGMVVDEKI